MSGGLSSRACSDSPIKLLGEQVPAAIGRSTLEESRRIGGSHAAASKLDHAFMASVWAPALWRCESHSMLRSFTKLSTSDCAAVLGFAQEAEGVAPFPRDRPLECGRAHDY